jgi:hypothetical protein
LKIEAAGFFETFIFTHNTTMSYTTYQVGVEVMFLACIREVLGSNLSRDTS